jgi:hypothetical protein
MDHPLQFILSLMVLFCAQAGCGLYLLMYGDRVKSQLTHTLHNTLNTDFGRQDAVTRAMDELQTTVSAHNHMCAAVCVQYGCCGAHNYSDWSTSEWYRTTNDADSLAARNSAL